MTTKASMWRVAFTRTLWGTERGEPLDPDDCVFVVRFADHMREALARIADDGVTPDEAKRIAKAARMGEQW